MVSRREPYSDTWEEFMTKMGKYTPAQWQGLFGNAQFSGPLAMIVGLSQEWRDRHSAELTEKIRQGRIARAAKEQAEAAALVEAERARLVERAEARKIRAAERRATIRRNTIRPNALRPYVDEATRTMMPVIPPKHADREAIRETDAAADEFFQGGDKSGRWGHHGVVTIFERTYEFSIQAWALVHPYGPPVSATEIGDLHKQMREVRDGATRRVVRPGVTPERALEIALAVLGQRDGH